MLEIIAEIGSTWFRPAPSAALNAALDSIQQASLAGATTVKFQLGLGGLYSRERAPKQWAACQNYDLPLSWIPELKREAKAAGVKLTASIFTPDIPNEHLLQLDGLKLASGELTEGSLSLIRRVVQVAERFGLPLAISTGTHTGADIEWGLKLIGPYRIPKVTLYNCVSEYPALPDDYNLESLFKFRDQVDDLGLSDHTAGTGLVDEAIRVGYTAFEKHFRLDDCPEDNPDYPHSLTPDLFTGYVMAIRQAEYKWIKQPYKQVQPGEAGEVRWMQRGRDGKRPREDAK